MARRDEAKWLPILEDARRTRAPHGEVAKRHGVTAAALKYHLYRDRQRDKKGAVRLLPVRADDTSSPGLTVQIGSMSLQFREGCDPSFVAGVLRALGDQPC